MIKYFKTIKWKKIFSVSNGNSKGYGYSKVVCILGFNIVIKKLPFVGFKKIIAPQKSIKILKDKINSKEPFMLIRFGNSEMSPIITYLRALNKSNIKFPQSDLDLMQNNAGFFSPTHDDIMKFVHESLNVIPNADFIVPVMLHSRENKMISFAKKAKLLAYDTIDILTNLNKSDFWLSALKGKKVLIIHPFVETIKKQYTKRKKLFKNPDFLPDFELKTIKAIQGLNPDETKNYASWWDALDSMYKQIEDTDFDIAIIGAGAFGIFLANKVKACGKQAIQLCGATQILFGIKGERWSPWNLYNDYWVSPSEDETPKNLSKFIENEQIKAYW